MTLAAPDDWNDHEKLYRAVFDALEEYTLVQTGERAAVIPSVSGSDVKVAYVEDFSVWLTTYEYETAEIRLTLRVVVYMAGVCAESMQNCGCLCSRRKSWQRRADL